MTEYHSDQISDESIVVRVELDEPDLLVDLDAAAELLDGIADRLGARLRACGDPAERDAGVYVLSLIMQAWAATTIASGASEAHIAMYPHAR